MTGQQVKAYVERVSTEIPAGRVGSVEDIGNALVFLASGASAYVRGIDLLRTIAHLQQACERLSLLPWRPAARRSRAVAPSATVARVRSDLLPSLPMSNLGPERSEVRTASAERMQLRRRGAHPGRRPSSIPRPRA